MLRATVLGEPGSGSTTFVGLFYTALIRAAGEHPDRIRFSLTSDSVELLSRLYAQLLSGEFPESPDPTTAATTRITLAFRRPAPGWNPFRHAEDFDTATKIEFRWLRREWDDLAKPSSARDSSSTPGTLLSECAVPIFVVSTLPLRAAPPSTDTTPQDSKILNILQGLARAPGPAPASSATVLHPIFLFTELDLLSEETLRRMGLGTTLEIGESGGARSRAQSTMFEKLIPRAIDFCDQNRGGVDAPRAYFSYVRLESGPAGPERIALRTAPDHRPEPIFPLEEYSALIDYLGELST